MDLNQDQVLMMLHVQRVEQMMQNVVKSRLVKTKTSIVHLVTKLLIILKNNVHSVDVKNVVNQLSQQRPAPVNLLHVPMALPRSPVQKPLSVVLVKKTTKTAVQQTPVQTKFLAQQNIRLTLMSPDVVSVTLKNVVLLLHHHQIATAPRSDVDSDTNTAVIQKRPYVEAAHKMMNFVVKLRLVPTAGLPLAELTLSLTLMSMGLLN